MAKEVRLPQLGQTMEEGTIVNCIVNLGGEVKKGDVIFEVETDKATLEMESPADGFVKYILVETGQTLPVGEAVLVLGDKDEDVPQSFVDSLKAGVPTAEAPAVRLRRTPATPAAEPVKLQSQPAETTGKVKASPRAKKLAEELGVNIKTVTGTGPAGRITEQDVKNAAEGKAAVPAVAASEVKPGDTIPVNRLQKITAQKMLQSKREIPCFYLTVKADVTDLVELRTELNQTGSIKVAYNDFIVRAVAIGMEKFPIMTGQLDGETIRLAGSIGVGLAISVPDGLVAPIIKDVNKKDVAQIANDSKALVEKARNNKLSPADLEGGCITVSNLGAFGIESFIPIVVPGQCSILGIGQITDTCVPDNGNIMVRKLMNMTLSVDHKVANGAYAAQFLDYVRKLMEDTSTFA
jgi:pyruvate dehydrogenase E2 component (dihydrolipoamide acetyltransferase)